MKKIVAVAVVLLAMVMMVVGFYGLYTKSEAFRTKYNRLENKIADSMHDSAAKFGIDVPHCHILEDDEIVVRVGGRT